MASLYVVEFSDVEKDAAGNPLPIGRFPGVAQGVVSFTTTAGTRTFNAATQFVQMASKTACRIEFGGGDATAGSGVFLPANVVRLFGVEGGSPLSVVIDAGL